MSMIRDCASLEYDWEQRWVERQGDRLAFYHYRRHVQNRPRSLDPDLVVRITGEGIEPDLSPWTVVRQPLSVSAAREGDWVIFRDRSDEILFVVRLVGEREWFWGTWARLLEDLMEGMHLKDGMRWQAALFRAFGYYGWVVDHKVSYDPLHPLPAGIRTESDMVDFLWRVARGEESVRHCGTQCRQVLEAALQTREARLAAAAPAQPGRMVEVDEQVFALVEVLAQVRPGPRKDILLHRLLALVREEV
jgi:hypothetical protein